MISWELNGTPPLGEAGDSKAFHWHNQQTHCLGRPLGCCPGCPEGHCPTALVPPQPKMEWPPSVAFVGLEPGTKHFVETPQQPHLHYHHRHSDQHQFHNYHHHPADYDWAQPYPQMAPGANSNDGNLFADLGPLPPNAHFQQNNSSTVPYGEQQQHNNEQYTTIIGGGQAHEQSHQLGTNIGGSSTSIPFDEFGQSMFDPLSVDTSVSWSGGEGAHSSTDETVEYSSLSQDEIYEQIQRECAEIEHQSSSGRLTQKRTKGSSARTITTKKAPSVVMKKRSTYSGRLSVSSLDSTEEPPIAASVGGGGRRERKKQLNRVAATRYREKKRKEREQTSGEMHELEQYNARLKADIAAVQAEMGYLKGLAAQIETARKRARRR